MNTKKPQSHIWKYYVKESSISARCIVCTKIIKHGGNTTNLHNHFKNTHKIHMESKSPLTEPTLHKQLKIKDITNTTIENIVKEQGQMDISSDSNIDDPSCKDSDIENSQNSVSTKHSLQSSKFNTEHKAKSRDTKITELFTYINAFRGSGSLANKLTNCILFMIASENLPLSIVESKAFKRLMNTTVPLYIVPSRRTITRMIDAKYDVLKQKFKEDLKLASSYTLTCDIWTDVGNQSYLGVTIHYLQCELILTNSTIGVFPLMENHTADYIRDMMLSIMQSFEINVSLCTAFVTDSAANMVKAITNEFGSDKHLPCIAHSLSHLVPDAMKPIPRLTEIIALVKSIVTLIKRSVVASDELKRLQIRDGKTDSTLLKFKQDVPTRWNSTYYMIERFLQLKDYVYPVLITCPTAPRTLSREEIDILEDIVQILGPIEFITNEISGDSYPTSSLVIPVIHCMKNKINNCVPLTIEGDLLQKNILSEIHRRFKDIESYQILAVSTLLDPRFKRLHFQSLRAASAALSYINNQMKLSSTNNKVNLESKTDLGSQIESKINKHNVWTIHDSLIDSCASFLDECGDMHLELRQYLNQPPISRNQNPFEYWQTLKPAYPLLFTIAMRYLSVVATSVPSERIFSKAGIIKSDLRNRLSGKRLNSLLFLGSLNEEMWTLD